MVRAFTYTFLLILCACSPSLTVTRKISDLSEKFSHHSGFVLCDPITGKQLVNVNGGKYFTPASNTKILTLFSALTTLGDSIPALKYRIAGDSLLISGSGDPSLFYQETYTNSRTVDFLQGFQGHIYLTPRNFSPSTFGPGWSWDDYDSYYQPERNEFPVYGNVITVKSLKEKNVVRPSIFSDSVDQTETRSEFFRRQSRNKFLIPAAGIKNKSVSIPFLTSGNLTARLLSDTLRKSVSWINKPVKTDRILYSIPSDSLYKTMMQKSDNLIAEQLLMMVADKKTDTLDAAIAIRKILSTELADLSQRPIWVDGSGLSRYNQITPEDITVVWKKILAKRSPERLFPLLAASGRNGTLSGLNKGTKPFVFGKTGTLSNNYSLSGYLITRRNRLLIFSSMNANFTVPARQVRDELENILLYIHDRY